MKTTQDLPARAGGKEEKKTQLVTFLVGEAFCGIDIQRVQEIHKPKERTLVPHAPPYVLGIFSLRGKMVTLIDLARKMGIPNPGPGRETRDIILNAQGETIGLRVGKVCGVIDVDREKISPPPSNLGPLQGAFIKGVLRDEGRLLAVLNVDRVLEKEA